MSTPGSLHGLLSNALALFEAAVRDADNRDEYMARGRELVREATERLRTDPLGVLPRYLGEALNSGDGTYRP